MEYILEALAAIGSSVTLSTVTRTTASDTAEEMDVVQARLVITEVAQETLTEEVEVAQPLLDILEVAQDSLVRAPDTILTGTNTKAVAHPKSSQN